MAEKPQRPADCNRSLVPVLRRIDEFLLMPMHSVPEINDGRQKHQGREGLEPPTLWLEGGDSLLDYEVVDVDVHGFAEFFEAFFPFFGPVACVAAAEEVVPDVLGLPDVYFEGHLVDCFCYEEGVGEGSVGGGIACG